MVLAGTSEAFGGRGYMGQLYIPGTVNSTVERAAGEHLESIEHLETYRDKQRLGEGRKSLVLKVVLRKADGTLTGEEAEGISQSIDAACSKDHGASLRT